MLMASLTFDMAPACDPGEPDGTDMGDDPIGGCPESEGGIMFGKDETTCACVSDDEPFWTLQIAGGAASLTALG